MSDGALKAALEREERAYEDLVRVRASLGTMLAEAIRTEGGLPEFSRRKEDLALLIQSADVRRTELKVELLGRQLKKAEKEHRRAIEAAKRTAAALEEARGSYARAADAERKWGHETRRLEELRREEMVRLDRLRSEEPPPEPPGAPSDRSPTATQQPGSVGPQTPLQRPEGEEVWSDTERGAQEAAERPQERSWWRRMFGG